jgi:hypothetical protein
MKNRSVRVNADSLQVPSFLATKKGGLDSGETTDSSGKTKYLNATILQGIDYLILTALCCSLQNGTVQPRYDARRLGAPGRSIIWHLLKPALFNLFLPRTGPAKILREGGKIY